MKIYENKIPYVYSPVYKIMRKEHYYKHVFFIIFTKLDILTNMIFQLAYIFTNTRIFL